MNTIEKIIAESKTQKQAVEKITAKAAIWEATNYDEMDFYKMVKDMKKAGELPMGPSLNCLGYLLTQQKAYNRRRDQVWLTENHPKDTINKAITRLDEKLAKWFEEAKTDSFYKLSWGSDAFKWAATRKAYLELQHWMNGVDHGASLDAQKWEMIIKKVVRETLGMARGGSRSTSACSNLADDYLMAAKASIANGDDWEISAISYWFDKKAKYDGETSV
jgi:hypothetical protein